MSGPKIIIKRPVHPLAAPATTPPLAEEEEEEDDDEDVEDVEANGTPLEGSEPEVEIDGQPEPGSPGPVIPVRRPRGRPRGSGRGAAPSSPSTRARGMRSRGRPRGSRARGRAGFTIRLPGRDGGDDTGYGPDGDIEGEYPEEYVYVPKPQFKTVHGTTYVIEGDQLIIPDDPKGDEKIDEWGNLKGDRIFKANTFLLPNRDPKRVYMLAIDAARTSGFRDSLYYFRRNPLTWKLNATQPEKDYLIEQGKLGPHLKTRSVTLITARSVFKLHGAKTVREGRWVVDDYYEDKVLAEIKEKGLNPGDLVGELPDPNAAIQTSNVAEQAVLRGERGGTKGIYQAGGPTTIFGGNGLGPFSDGPLNAVRKSLLSRDGLTEENYMHQAALRAMDASEQWAQSRRLALTNQKEQAPESQDPVEVIPDQPPVLAPMGSKIAVTHPLSYYEAHTGTTHFGASTQPTRSRWETLPDHDSKRILGGTKTGSGAWGLAWVDDVYESSSPAARQHEMDAFVQESIRMEQDNQPRR